MVIPHLVEASSSFPLSLFPCEAFLVRKSEIQMKRRQKKGIA
jgi:hypothetical protein